MLQAERGIDTPARVSGTGAGAASVRATSQLYPDAWTAAANALGDLHARQRIASRGFAWTAPSGGTYRLPGFGVIQAKAGEGWIEVNDQLANAVHEYAHRLQSALPELNRLFLDLHRRRTAGDPLERLLDLYPSSTYGPAEWARKDRYLDYYQGKEYAGKGALEVMTMAFQYVLGGKLSWLRKLLEQDREMLDFVVGLLRYWAP